MHSIIFIFSVLTINTKFKLIKSWYNHLLNSIKLHFLCPSIFFRVALLVLAALVSKEHPLCVEDPQLGHEVKIDKGQTDQQVLHQEEDRCDKTKEGNKTNAYKKEG